jgi:hypothetical protein
MTNASTLVKMIQEVKTAIQTLNGQKDSELTKITSAKLELHATTSESIGGAVEWKLIDLDMNLNDSTVQTLTLELEPDEIGHMGEDALENISNGLINAIETIKIGIKAAKSTEPHYKMKSAIVTLNIGVERGGGFKFFGVGMDKKDSYLHTITLSIGPYKT